MSRAEAEGKVKDSSVQPLEGTKVLDTQVGGHRYGNNGKKIGMLDRGNGIVLKAVQNPPRGTREKKLYQTVFAPGCKDKVLLELRSFMPLYYGTETVDDVTFLVMNNIVHTFPKPNVLDLKMGRVTYDPEATAEKRESEECKYPPLRQLGFQFTGMMMHDSASGAPQHFTKDFCRSITAETMLTEGLGRFFGLQNGNLRKDVLNALLHKLRRIEKWFLVQQTFAFYASSLLIVYSSLDQAQNSTTAEREIKPKGDHPCTNLDFAEDVGTLNDATHGAASSNATRSPTAKDSAANTDQRPSLKRVCSVDSEAHCREAEIGTNPKQSKAWHNKTEGQSELPAGEKETRGLGMCKSDRPLVEVRMIDFAHVFPASGRDDNYLFGLHNLITFVEQLLKL